MKVCVLFWCVWFSLTAFGGRSCVEVLTATQSADQLERLRSAQRSDSIEVRYLQKGEQVIVLLASNRTDPHPDDKILSQLMEHAPFAGRQNRFAEGIGLRLAEHFPALADKRRLERRRLSNIFSQADAMVVAIDEVLTLLQDWKRGHEGEEGEFPLDIKSTNELFHISGDFDLEGANNVEDGFRKIREILAVAKEPTPSTAIALEKGHRTTVREHLFSIYLETRIGSFMIDQYYAVPKLIRLTIPFQLLAPLLLPGGIGWPVWASGTATLLLKLMMEMTIAPQYCGLSCDWASTRPRSKTLTRNLLKALKENPEQSVMVNYVGNGMLPHLVANLAKAGFVQVEGLTQDARP